METNRLKVLDLSETLTVADLKVVFKNKNKHGGGPVTDVLIHSNNQECYAIITFESEDAVEHIMKNGDTVPIKDEYVKIERMTDSKSCFCKKSLNENINLNDKSQQRKEKDIEAKEEKLIKSKDEILDENINDNIWHRTVKAHICDIEKKKKFYQRYLRKIGMKNYDQQSMMLDGLHKVVFITFQNKTDAENMCQMHHELKASNMVSVEMSTSADFDTYEDRIFLFGIDIPEVKEEFKQAISQQTKQTVKFTIQNDEKKAAIFVFDEQSCPEIAQLTWDLTKIDGCTMITAPVKKESILLFQGLDGRLRKKTLEKCLQYKEENGVKIKPIDYLKKDAAIVEFLNHSDVENIMNKHGHILEKYNLGASLMHSCLNKHYLQHFIKDNQEAVVNQDLNYEHNDGCENDINETEVKLTIEEISLLEKCDFLNQLSQNLGVQVDLQQQTPSVVIKGKHENQVLKAELEINKKCRELKQTKLNDISQEQLYFLKNANFRQKLNCLLKDGYIALSKDQVILTYFDSIEPYVIKEQVKALICVQQLKLSEENSQILQSNKGKKFLTEFCSLGNKNFIHLDTNRKILLYIAPDDEKSIEIKVSQFLYQNNYITKTMSCPERIKKYILKCKQLKLKEIADEIKLKSTENGFIIEGCKENVIKFIWDFTSLRKNIHHETITLQYHGIKEFLQSQIGQSLLENLEVINNCSIILDEVMEIPSEAQEKFMQTNYEQKEFSGRVNISTLEMNIQHIKVILEEGEISTQKSDIIAITVNKNFDLKVGNISKALLEKAGEKIQQELKTRSSTGHYTGSIARTSGGNLPVKNILYGHLMSYIDAGNISKRQLQQLVTTFLKEANQLSAETLSIPALGTGKLHYPADISAQSIIDAITEFAKSHPKSKLRAVTIVVFPSDIDVTNAFRAVFPLNASYPSNNYHNLEANKKAAVNMKQYGDLKLIIEYGDITKTCGCDVIVNSIKDNMDLSMSGKVCKALLDVCQKKLQSECTQNRYVMEKNGIVYTDAPNLHCKGIIHISQDRYAKNWGVGILQVLEEADRRKASSLALPALGSGSRHADLQEVKKTIMTAIKKFSKKARSLKLIKLVIFDQKILNVFLNKDEIGAASFIDEHIGADTPHSVHSQEVCLYIMSEDAKTIAFIKEELKKECEASYQCRTIEVSDGIIRDHMEDILSFACNKGIKVNTEQNLIRAKCFNDAYLKELECNLQKLEESEIEKKPKLRPIEPSFIWQFKKGKQWTDFEPVLNSQLEIEYIKKTISFAALDSNGDTIVINFEKMKKRDYGFTKICVEEDIRRINMTKK